MSTYHFVSRNHQGRVISKIYHLYNFTNGLYQTINDNTEGFKALYIKLKSHIETLENSWSSEQDDRSEVGLAAQRDFIHAVNEYIRYRSHIMSMTSLTPYLGDSRARSMK
jgi:hypothetical protein